VDPCLLFKFDVKGVLYICLYVDDLLCIGDRKAINAFIAEVRKHYAIKQMGKMDEYVGCKVIPSNKGGLYLAQPDLITKMKKVFEDYIGGRIKYVTPGAPGEIIARPSEDSILVNDADQKRYQSGVGMLLYLTKHSRYQRSCS
jgi:hypothetical protein